MDSTQQYRGYRESKVEAACLNKCLITLTCMVSHTQARSEAGLSATDMIACDQMDHSVCRSLAWSISNFLVFPLAVYQGNWYSLAPGRTFLPVTKRVAKFLPRDPVKTLFFRLYASSAIKNSFATHNQRNAAINLFASSGSLSKNFELVLSIWVSPLTYLLCRGLRDQQCISYC